jgi:6-phosphogluconolactonase
MIERHDFATMLDASTALATYVATTLQTAVETRGAASLAVSGGKSPVPFFHALRVQAIDWQNVSITLADDRQVDASSPLSNAALVVRELLQAAAADARFVPLVPGADIMLPLDMLVLGMGLDAHVASLFPGQPMEGADIIAVLPDPLPAEAPVARWSFSMPVLRRARATALLISGAAKRAVLDNALLHPDLSGKPVSALLYNPCNPVHIYWSAT